MVNFAHFDIGVLSGRLPHGICRTPVTNRTIQPPLSPQAPSLLDAAVLMQTPEIVSHGVWNIRPKAPRARFTDTPSTRTPNASRPRPPQAPQRSTKTAVASKSHPASPRTNSSPLASSDSPRFPSVVADQSSKPQPTNRPSPGGFFVPVQPHAPTNPTTRPRLISTPKLAP